MILNNWDLTFQHPITKEIMTIAAQVPGNVIADLYRNGVIDDPFYSDNSVRMRPFEFIDWEYSTTFEKIEKAEDEKLFINFEGIDTIAEIFVNGEKIGSANNMFIAHKFELPANLKDINELKVKISSPITEARKYTYPTANFAMPYNFESLYIRRAAHTYGWDIFPRLIGAGLWRKVEIIKEKPIAWIDVYLMTSALLENGARMVLNWNFRADNVVELDGFEGELRMKCKNSTFSHRFVIRFISGTRTFVIDNPLLWNVIGQGEQNLYDVELDLIYNGKVVDCKKFRTGIRTIELRRTDLLDENRRGQFHFYVNNREVFLKGSNWVPTEALHGEEKSEKFRAILELFKESNSNVIRCWGGGVYEDHEFFDLCDEMGFLIWQDFMFACAFNPQDNEFLSRVRIEAESVVKKLRQHPSLGLWCGDNEVDVFISWSHVLRKRFSPEKNRITREVLAEVVRLYDTGRDYLPSSPYFPPSLNVLTDDLGDKAPENHLWGPRDYYKSKYYIDPAALFASEIGYHGMPNFNKLEKFVDKETLKSKSKANKNLGWICHASQPCGDVKGPWAFRLELMDKQVNNVWGKIPDDVETFVGASQIVQAEAKKFFIENFRLTRDRRSGIIWWNMIDGWPQFSDAVVDYYFGKKLAFDYIKNIQQPLIIGIREPNENGMNKVVAVNDNPFALSGDYVIYNGDTMEEIAKGEFAVGENTLQELPEVKLENAEIYIIKWNCNGKSYFNHYQAGVPPFDSEKYIRIMSEFYPQIKNFKNF